ncbi:alpha-N-acetylglucosaminidase [Wenjunlia vitaminophila]|uniref:Alpha-N-acetylglucosaminidase n=1 Tax=Wenjunlia vitaminophila TaxID=76728 RepID=A0A0T6LTU1_WENVI|nr:alpha-N-acetylglucosaminidase [Wenjunlia vitaminophila]KRV49250.1 alpha-N-acetylglucosaminidase [Wenjunlia vitaminophila]
MIRRRTILGTAAGVTAAGGLGGSAAAASQAGRNPPPAGAPAAGPDDTGALFDPSPAQQALLRLLPHHADQVRLRAAERDLTPGGPVDWFRVSGTGGKVTVDGTSPAVLLTGVHWYLKYSAGVDVSWPGHSLDRLPRRLPAPARELHREAVVRNRFALNDTHEGYTGPYRDWADWEREIDLLALNGINQVLVTTGQEAVYHRALGEFGYSDQEMRRWIPGPAHQPWWLLQNLSEFGGPLSSQLLRARISLGRKVVERLRSLGMESVLPGWFGTVPVDFAERNPGAHTVPQGDWLGAFTRPHWLDPRGDHFASVGEAFYRHQAELFGAAGHVKMDLLHEGGTPGDVPVPDAARGVMAALQRARPGAVWVLLGWQANPRREVLEAVDRERLLVVDGLSDRYPDLDREKAWVGTPYAFGTIYNFGGHTTVGANTAVWARRFDAWRTRPGSRLTGIALMPEGMGTNPAANDLFTELAWRQGPVDHRAWFAEWADRRYGGGDRAARAAWEILRRTAYSLAEGRWSEAQDSLFTARPSLTATSAASWSPKEMRYDADAFEPALGELLRVAAPQRATDAYRFDLVDVARQALANRSRLLLPRIRDAHRGQDRETFTELTGQWLTAMELLEELLASDPRFLLGRWLRDATRWAADDQEAARLEFDARSIITVWGPRRAADPGGLRDYANREWSGLVGDFYLPRWRRYFAALEETVDEGAEPEPIDWFALEDAWTRRRGGYPVEPTGDPHRIAGRVWRTLRDTHPEGDGTA